MLLDDGILSLPKRDSGLEGLNGVQSLDEIEEFQSFSINGNNPASSNLNISMGIHLILFRLSMW